MTASFVTNTNWQPIAGETNLSYFSQAVGLAVQNFLSPAVGIAVAFALLRGLASSDGGKLGSFFVDVVRAVLYVLLPLSLVLALVGVWQGSPQTFQGYEMVQLLEPVSVDAEGALVDADDPTAVQEVTEAVVPLGPQSSQVAIKQLGTNGGGFNGANSASALENPTPLTNLLQCAAMPLIPFALVFAFGRMVGDRRQSRALMTVVLAILAAGLFSVIAAETAATPQLSADGAVYLGALDQSAGNMEGKECRIGVGESAGVDGAHERYFQRFGQRINRGHDSYRNAGAAGAHRTWRGGRRRCRHGVGGPARLRGAGGVRCELDDRTLS